ncbi:MAG: hypothetical protein JNK45_20930 [Myxococcales bacterium]|nr:hypothetical protein [Myxococcales bacterium]
MRPWGSTRRRAAIAVGSIALHGGLFATLSALPNERAATPDESAYEPIEFVVWEPAAITAAPRPTDVATPATPTTTDAAGPPAEPTVAPEPIASPTPARPKPRSDGPAPSEPITPPPAASTPTPPVAPPVAPDPTPSPAPGAIALQGVPHVSAPGIVTSPRLGASAIRELGDGVVTAPKPSGPAAPSRPGPGGGGGRDTPPRTLEDAGFVRDKKGNYAYREPAGHFTAKLLPDGRVRFKDHIGKVTGTAVKMPDLYSVVTKARKQNELWAHDKAELLRRTYELRLAIAVKFAEHNIETRIKSMYRELLDVWGAPDRPALARRKILFERWDDCDERMRVTVPGFEDVEASKLDTVRLDAAARARTTIVDFVRKHLPKGTPDAYGADELAQLNRGRKSTEKFAPYADG